MKKRMIILCCMILVLVGSGWRNPAELTSKRKTTSNYFGTICFVIAYDDFSEASAQTRWNAAWKEIDQMLAQLEQRISLAVPNSDISRFNRARCGETVRIQPVTAEIVRIAMDAHEQTDGAYNPAVANLVDLWGFSPRFLNREDMKMPYDRPRNKDGSFGLPDARYVEAFKRLSDFSQVELDGDEINGYTLTKRVSDIEIDGVVYSLQIDLGGIGKGCAADWAADILRKNGYAYGLANIGMSSLSLLERNVSDKEASGKNMWAVNVAVPYHKGERYLTAFGKNEGVSTSGTYDLRYYLNGREYGHIIDARTGEPAETDIVSVTVLGGEAGYCDALSTALCVMGKESAVGYMNEYLKDYKVAIILRNGELITNMPKDDYILRRQ